MYCVTIAKLKGKEWAGFNMLSQLLLIGDLERECESYGTTFKPVDKGSFKLIEVDWNGFLVMIQYRRIN